MPHNIESIVSDPLARVFQVKIKSFFFGSHIETFEKCSILLKIKEDENFNNRNTLCISRIKIWDWRRDWAKVGVLQRSHILYPNGNARSLKNMRTSHFIDICPQRGMIKKIQWAWCRGRNILSRDDLIQIEGEVTRVLGGGTMEIQCENNVTIRGVLSGRMKKHRIKVMVGDRVQVSVSPYDTTHGLITYRFWDPRYYSRKISPLAHELLGCGLCNEG